MRSLYSDDDGDRKEKSRRGGGNKEHLYHIVFDVRETLPPSAVWIE
jgi:hypothetical protein